MTIQRVYAQEVGVEPVSYLEPKTFQSVRRSKARGETGEDLR